MLKQLISVRGKLEALRDKAEEYQDSDNEKTQEKYDGIAGMLDAAIDAVNEAIHQLED